MNPEVSKLPPLQQIGWLNVNSSTFYKLAELAATPRNQTLIDAGRIIRVYGEGSDPWESCRPTAALSADREAGEIHTWLNHERDPHCCGCYVIDGRSLIAKCNECGHTVDAANAITRALNASQPAVAAPVGEVYRLHECVAFFASVIKGGEQWSDACQHAYDMAVASSGQKAN